MYLQKGKHNTFDDHNLIKIYYIKSNSEIKDVVVY